MRYSSPKQLYFPPVAGHTVRADCEGGALSADFGPLLLRGLDHQIGLSARLAAAVQTSDLHPLSTIPCPISSSSASPRLPQAMRTAMMRTACALTPGAENAMLLVRLLSSLRHHWPHTYILVHGNRHFAIPEVIDVVAHWRWTDFVFGLAGHAGLLRQAAPSCRMRAVCASSRPPSRKLIAHVLPPAAVCRQSFPQPRPPGPSPGRVILKAAVMPLAIPRAL
jgi:hypothetical protein